MHDRTHDLAPRPRSRDAHRRVRTARRAAAGLLVLALAACGSRLPDPQLYRLDASVPAGAGPQAAVPPAAAGDWQLLLPVALPDYLDHDGLLLPQGPAQVQRLSRHRWAEPLAEAVPRLLRHDLGRLVGAARLWTSPVPAGVVVRHQVRVELLAFEAAPDQRSVRLAARLVWVDPGTAGAARTQALELQVPNEAGGIDGLVAAHRLALWRLAERIVALGRGG